jgi:short-subunit dehydrogenase
MKKIIIVGASSGIGAEIARLHLKQGAMITMIARREVELKKIAAEFPDAKPFLINHDVKETSNVFKLFDQIIKNMGGLDEIYYCSGIINPVKMDEFSTEKDLETIQVNLNGAIAWLNEAARFFQNQKSGKIIGISSIAGDRGRVGSPVYNTSKAALNTYLEALRNRLSRKGILVLTAKPGFIDTKMTKGMKGLFWLISPEKAAEIIVKAANNNKENIYVPARWWLVGTIIKSIPSFIFKKLNV